jgi:membrane-associated protease RseP (regulator of RpoE activity)
METSAFNLVLSLVSALVLHEAGHFVAARACKIRVIEAGLGCGPLLLNLRIREVDYQLHLLPLGAYVRMDMNGLQKRPLSQQLLVLLAGIGVNFALSAIAWGSFFGTLNLILALGNLFPLYQQDGWKSGMVIFRRAFGRPSPLVEWCFTVSGVMIGFALLALSLFSL